MPAQEFAIAICRHIKTNGVRCQSPTLRSEPFCYFHLRLHKDHPAPLSARQLIALWQEGDSEAIANGGEDPMQIARAFPRQNEFNFPPLEDAESIQLAASMLFHAVAQGQIHLRRARILRDMLRVANASGRRVTSAPADTPVRDLDQTPEGVPLAPVDFVDSPGVTVPAHVPMAHVASAQAPANQEFTPNPSELNILQSTPPGTLAN
jgi:hypothetical protein